MILNLNIDLTQFTQKNEDETLTMEFREKSEDEPYQHRFVLIDKNGLVIRDIQAPMHIDNYRNFGLSEQQLRKVQKFLAEYSAKERIRNDPSLQIRRI